MTEHFAHIKIQEPRHINANHEGPAINSREEGPTTDWGEGRLRPVLSNGTATHWDEGCPRSVDLAEVITSATLKDLCENLGIPLDNRTGRRRDRELLTTLNYRLYRRGLRMGRHIIGKAIPKPDEQIYLYPLDYGETPKRGTLPPSMFLAAWLVSADGVTQKDLDIIDQWLIKTIGSLDEAIPAMATMRWLTHRKLILTAWRKARCESLSKFVHRRAALVNLLLTLVSDGPSVSPQRLTRLETVYRLIGLDPADIHSDLHRLSTGIENHYMTNKQALTGREGRPRTGQPDGTFNRHRLAEISANTSKAQAILSQVFADDEPTGGLDADASSTVAKLGTVSSMEAGSHKPEPPIIPILRELASHSSWTRGDFERLAKDQRYTPGALLEALNDLAYDTVGDPVAEEDDDSILIDIPIAQEILDRMKE